MGRNPADWQRSGVRQGWGGLGILGRWAGPGRQWPRSHHLSVRYLNIPSLYFCCFLIVNQRCFRAPKQPLPVIQRSPFSYQCWQGASFFLLYSLWPPPHLCLTLIFKLLKKILLTFVRTPWTCQHKKKEFSQEEMFQFFPNGSFLLYVQSQVQV